MIAKNDPCSCGSRKKYKRCCGAEEKPLAAPQTPAMGGFDPSQFDPSRLDPDMMQQMQKAIKRLPRGQVMQMQNLMQKAMRGEDIASVADQFEKTLPADFQELMRGLAFQAAAQQAEVPAAPVPTQEEMDLEEARQVVAAAMEAGSLSRTEGEELLQSKEPNAPAAAKARSWPKWLGKK